MSDLTASSSLPSRLIGSIFMCLFLVLLFLEAVCPSLLLPSPSPFVSAFPLSSSSFSSPHPTPSLDPATRPVPSSSPPDSSDSDISFASSISDSSSFRVRPSRLLRHFPAPVVSAVASVHAVGEFHSSCRTAAKDAFWCISKAMQPLQQRKQMHEQREHRMNHDTDSTRLPWTRFRRLHLQPIRHRRFGPVKPRAKSKYDDSDTDEED